MLIAVTGATGFLGRYLVNHLTGHGHRCRCWYRPHSDRGGFDDENLIEWLPGELDIEESTESLVRNADAVVHAGLAWGIDGGGLVDFAQTNVLGSLKLMAAARWAGD